MGSSSSAQSSLHHPLWRTEYPFASHWLELGPYRYHYLDQNPNHSDSNRNHGASSESGPLLLVHGNPTWSFYWRKLIVALQGSHRLIAPDHMGCGLSDKPADYPYTLEQHISNLTQLIERLDLRNITLVAQDWGGAIGMGAAARMPERFSRFVLSNTGAFRSQAIPWRIKVCRIPGFAQLSLQGMNAFSAAAVRMAVARPDKLTPAARDGYLSPYSSWANRVAVYNFVQDIPLHKSHRSYQTLADVESGLAQFASHPSLLLWGMKDWCFTPQDFMVRFQEFWPQAVTRQLNQAGHWALEDEPEEFIASVKNFLQTTAAPKTQGS